MPGSEVAGTVAEVGQGVTGFAEGDPVVALLLTPEGMGGTGGYADLAVADATRTLAIPDGVAEGAALAVLSQGLTAWLLLTRAAPLQRGQSVLVHAAAGGVGSFAVQFAKLLGAGLVVGTAGSAAKRVFVAGIGADAAVDSTDTEWWECVTETTGGRGIDVILDPIAGAASAKAIALLAPRGRLVVFGGMSGTMPDFTPAE